MKIKDYTVKVSIELDVQAKGRRQVKVALKEIQWDDIHYRCPRSGFLTDWSIKAKPDSMEIIGIEEE